VSPQFLSHPVTAVTQDGAVLAGAAAAGGVSIVDETSTVCRAVTDRRLPTRGHHIRLCGLLASQWHLGNAAAEAAADA
jgi:hypothetical protein